MGLYMGVFGSDSGSLVPSASEPGVSGGCRGLKVSEEESESLAKVGTSPGARES